MKIFKDKLSIAIIIVAIILISSILMTYQSKTNVSLIENALGFIIEPIQGLFYGFSSKASGVVSGINNYKSVSEENIKLQAEIDKLKTENRRVYQLQIENDTLRESLNFFEQNTHLEYIGATITAKDPGNWFETFIINKGSADDVAINDAVMIGTGLVGRVVEVATTYSKVVSIIDERSSISIIINRTRDTGIATGTVQKGITASMLLDADIIVGDEVVTSEYSTFPKGLYLGIVTNVILDEAKASKYVEIEPAVNFERLEQVFIVKEK